MAIIFYLDSGLLAALSGSSPDFLAFPPETKMATAIAIRNLEKCNFNESALPIVIMRGSCVSNIKKF